MSASRRRTPQEKKQISLEKDRRNVYGEHDKASRKAIPAAKARVNRANRHLDRQTLDGATGPLDESREGLGVLLRAHHELDGPALVIGVPHLGRLVVARCSRRSCNRPQALASGTPGQQDQPDRRRPRPRCR